jgi:TPR repeat protein
VLLHPPDQLLFDTNTRIAYQGYAKAQSNLGIAYAFGKGVLKDDKKAVYWYQKAADQTPLPKVYLTPRLNCAFASP